jgi:hypothetical protein
MLDILIGAGGGVVGVLGALFKHGIEIWQEKKKAEASLAVLVEQNKHELAMADKQTQLMELEARSGLALAEVNKNKELGVAELSALAASYDSDKATYSDAKTNVWMIAVDAARGFIRPLLTLVFSATLIAMTIWLWTAVPEAVYQDGKFLSETFIRLLEALIFLATNTVGWWFAARQLTK